MYLHHVQVSMPTGREDEARSFWATALGLSEVEKPADLAGRGGCWFRAYAADGSVAAEIHVGVEEPFAPARKAHPALGVSSRGQLEALAARIESGGGEIVWTERHTFAGYERFHTSDPFGNRVEVLSPAVEGAVVPGAAG